MTQTYNEQEISGFQEQFYESYPLYIDAEIHWLNLNINLEKIRCMLFLWDPQGMLRLQYMSCNNDKTVLLHRDPVYSSNLTVSGSLPIGNWKLELLGGPTQFTLKWNCGLGVPPEPFDACQLKQVWCHGENEGNLVHLNTYPWQAKRKGAKRWYKGDFHTHTTLSDGKLTPEDGMRQAEMMELDFFVATDHNLMPTCWPEGTPLVIPGMEISSTKRGHFNALGLRRWVDWRQIMQDGGMDSDEGMNRILRETKQAGALCSINHPLLIHWSWAFNETPINSIDALEIWNDPTYPKNAIATEQTLDLWSAIWNEGYRIPGIGGSDSHNLPTESYTDDGSPSLIGDPATYVYADGLSAEEILNAVRKGNVYVTRGPILTGVVSIGGESFIFGSDLTRSIDQSPDESIHFQLTVMNQSSGSLHWIENGREVFRHQIQGDGGYEYNVNWNTSNFTWMRIEIRDDESKLLSFSNPVYCGIKISELTTWGQLKQSLSYK